MSFAPSHSCTYLAPNNRFSPYLNPNLFYLTSNAFPHLAPLLQSPLRTAAKTPPTVVPSKPVGPSKPLLVGGVKSCLGSKSGSPVGRAKAAAGGEGKAVPREIDPPPLTEKVRH